MARLRVLRTAWAFLMRAGLALALLPAGTPRTFAAQVSAAVRAAAKPLYAPVGAQWSKAIAGLALPPSLGLKPEDLDKEDRRQVLAPLVFQLAQSLGLDAAAFEAIEDPTERQAALLLAAEEAAGVLEAQGGQLIARANVSVWSRGRSRSAQLKNLPELLAWLGEMRGYGAYLSPDLQGLLAQSHAQAEAFSKGIDSRRIAADAQETARRLTGGGPGEDSPEEEPPLAPRRHGSGEKLLDRMKQTKAGWGQRQIHRLLKSFGFNLVQSGHRRYRHHRFARLQTTVPRQNELPVGYIKDLINLMEELKLLEAQAAGAALPAAELSVAAPAPMDPAAGFRPSGSGKGFSKKSRRLAPAQALAEETLASLDPPSAREALPPPAIKAAVSPPAAPALQSPPAPEARAGGWRGLLRSVWAALARRDRG